MRTVPVPGWVKRAIDAWIAWAEISGGTIFRRVNRMGKVWGDGITPKEIWHIVKGAAQRAGIKNPAPPRFAPQLRQVVPLGGWRTRTNPVSARPRDGSNDRALPGPQAETSARGERQPRP